jgi:hypothetical protein
LLDLIEEKAGGDETIPHILQEVKFEFVEKVEASINPLHSARYPHIQGDHHSLGVIPRPVKLME